MMPPWLPAMGRIFATPKPSTPGYEGEHGKTKSPRPALRPNGGIWGLGVRHSLFPTLTLGAPSRGCQLPDAILHGKRNYRPHSRAVQGLAAAELWSEASWLAWAGVCSAGLRTRSRHVYEFGPRLDQFALGRPPLSAMRWPSATGLASYLSGCLSSQASGVVGNIAGDLEDLLQAVPRLVFPSHGARSLCPAFRRLSLGRPFRSDRPSRTHRADSQ